MHTLSLIHIYLAKAGIDVLLLERDIFPREKACGDVLREGFVSHVEALGIAGDLDAMSTCVRRLKLISDDGHTTTIPFECYCAPRRDVDSLLVDTAISLGAEAVSYTHLHRDRGYGLLRESRQSRACHGSQDSRRSVPGKGFHS